MQPRVQSRRMAGICLTDRVVAVGSPWLEPKAWPGQTVSNSGLQRAIQHHSDTELMTANHGSANLSQHTFPAVPGPACPSQHHRCSATTSGWLANMCHWSLTSSQAVQALALSNRQTRCRWRRPHRGAPRPARPWQMPACAPSPTGVHACMHLGTRGGRGRGARTRVTGSSACADGWAARTYSRPSRTHARAEQGQPVHTSHAKHMTRASGASRSSADQGLPCLWPI